MKLNSAFEAEIVERPGDDAPRLVYAALLAAPHLSPVCRLRLRGNEPPRARRAGLEERFAEAELPT